MMKLSLTRGQIRGVIFEDRTYELLSISIFPLVFNNIPTTTGVGLNNACLLLLFPWFVGCWWLSVSVWLITGFYEMTLSYLGQDVTQGQFFQRGLTGLNSEFSFSYTSCLTKAEEPSLPYYLPIAGGRIIGFIPFPRVLVLCEMQSVSSRIWTRVAVSIS